MYQETREEEDLPGVDASIQRLYDYIQKHDGGLITVIRKRYWQHDIQQNDNN